MLAAALQKQDLVPGKKAWRWQFQRQTLFLKNKDHMKVSKLKLEAVKTVNLKKFYYLKPSRILLLHSHHFVTFLCPRNKNVSTQGWLYANIINSWFFHSKFEMILFMQNQFFKWWQKIDITVTTMKGKKKKLLSTLYFSNFSFNHLFCPFSFFNVQLLFRRRICSISQQKFWLITAGGCSELNICPQCKTIP